MMAVMMSVFQIYFVYHTLTQAIFKMTQLKMTCGTYDPLWQISRLNTAARREPTTKSINPHMMLGPEIEPSWGTLVEGAIPSSQVEGIWKKVAKKPFQCNFVQVLIPICSTSKWMQVIMSYHKCRQVAAKGCCKPAQSASFQHASTCSSIWPGLYDPGYHNLNCLLPFVPTNQEKRRWWEMKHSIG